MKKNLARGAKVELNSVGRENRFIQELATSLLFFGAECLPTNRRGFKPSRTRPRTLATWNRA